MNRTILGLVGGNLFRLKQVNTASKVNIPFLRFRDQKQTFYRSSGDTFSVSKACRQSSSFPVTNRKATKPQRTHISATQERKLRSKFFARCEADEYLSHDHWTLEKIFPRTLIILGLAHVAQYSRHWEFVRSSSLASPVLIFSNRLIKPFVVGVATHVSQSSVLSLY